MKKVYLVVPQFKGVEEYDFTVNQEFSTKKEAEAYGEKNYPGIYEIEEVIENRHLLYIDIMGRIPYGTKFRFELDKKTFKTISFNEDKEIPCLESIYSYWIRKGYILPYLRSMSSMTTEEGKEFVKLHTDDRLIGKIEQLDGMSVDWLNSHFFDYRGLIKMGLAIEAPKDMYNFNTKTK
jgi:hypothetical protein